jgi:hypothetical protein
MGREVDKELIKRILNEGIANVVVNCYLLVATHVRWRRGVRWVDDLQLVFPSRNGTSTNTVGWVWRREPQIGLNRMTTFASPLQARFFVEELHLLNLVHPVAEVVLLHLHGLNLLLDGFHFSLDVPAWM